MTGERLSRSDIERAASRFNVPARQVTREMIEGLKGELPIIRSDYFEELRQRLKTEGGGSMDEIQARRIAEEAAEIALSRLSESDNPLSVKCERVLGTTPKCYDFRGIRRWVMCKAWDTMETRRVPFGAAISEAWDKAKGVCSWE